MKNTGEIGNPHMPKEERNRLVDAFAVLMKKELDDNVQKGDWRGMSLGEATTEIRYHFEKLEMAMDMKDRAAIIEYATDVANQAMILLDVYGYITEDMKRSPVPKKTSSIYAYS